jgi:hypothetical protein
MTYLCCRQTTQEAVAASCCPVHQANNTVAAAQKRTATNPGTKAFSDLGFWTKSRSCQTQKSSVALAAWSSSQFEQMITTCTQHQICSFLSCESISLQAKDLWVRKHELQFENTTASSRLQKFSLPLYSLPSDHEPSLRPQSSCQQSSFWRQTRCLWGCWRPPCLGPHKTRTFGGDFSRF